MVFYNENASGSDRLTLSEPIVYLQATAESMKRLVQPLNQPWTERRQEPRQEQHHESWDAILSSLALVTAYRDRSTGAHNERTGQLVTILACAYGQVTGHPLSDRTVLSLSRSATLHDIGKIAIPEAVLWKPGPLTEVELILIRKHTLIGGEMLRQIQNLSGDGYFLQFAIEMAECHHEHYDGTGYPKGLSGDDIPVSAQLMAVADVYDALVTDRPYKRAVTHDDAARILLTGDEKTQPSHFSKDILSAFERCMVSIREINSEKLDERSA